MTNFAGKPRVSDHVEEIEKNDDGDGNPKSPQQNSAHGHTSLVGDIE
jgi:hypothetical protein